VPQVILQVLDACTYPTGVPGSTITRIPPGFKLLYSERIATLNGKAVGEVMVSEQCQVEHMCNAVHTNDPLG
jgi:hypothetical protein